jgi:hypothetical protein
MATLRHLGLFPFCVIEKDPQETVFPNIYSVGLNLETTLDLFWRIKKWRVEVGVVSGFSDIATVDARPSVTLESSLVCAGEIDITQFNTAFDPGSGEDAWGFFLFSQTAPEILPPLLFYDNIYYPAIISVFGADIGDAVTWDQNDKSLSLVASGSNFLKAQPEKWWPYDPGDGGGPIYDEDTGAQIRDMPP